MRNLWCPKANVLIFDLEDDGFAFGFNNLYEQTSILRGGPWLFNKEFLLLLTEVGNMAHPTRVPLYYQEFWVQVKGLPFSYMTRQMGEVLCNH